MESHKGPYQLSMVDIQTVVFVFGKNHFTESDVLEGALS
jgi:hypothetical protein